MISVNTKNIIIAQKMDPDGVTHHRYCLPSCIAQKIKQCVGKFKEESEGKIITEKYINNINENGQSGCILEVASPACY